MKPKLIFGEKTHMGIQKDPSFNINGDSLFFNSEKGIFIIADGYGGKDHFAFEERLSPKFSSELAVNLVGRSLEEMIDSCEDAQIFSVMEESIKKSNEEICSACSKNKVQAGTTLDAVLIKDQTLYTAHIGDSRIYVLREDGSFEKLTKDGNEASELVESGKISDIAAKLHPEGYLITNSLGSKKDIDISLSKYPLENIRKILMVTDGLTDLLTDEEIRRILCENTPQGAANELVYKANHDPSEEVIREYSNQKGISFSEAKRKLAGKDNITTIVIQPFYEEKDLEDQQDRLQRYAKLTSGLMDRSKELLAVAKDLKSELKSKENETEKQRNRYKEELAEKDKLLQETIEKYEARNKQLQKIIQESKQTVLETVEPKKAELELYESGVRAYKQKDYSTAKNLLEKLVNLDNKNSAALRYYADSLAETGRWDKAAEQYIKCLDTDPKNSHAYNGLACIYISKGEKQKAISAWGKSAELGNLFAMHNLLHFKEYSGRLTKKEKEQLDKLNQGFAEKRIDDLEFIELYEYAKSLLNHPYTRFGTSTLENTKAILEQQDKLYGHITENDIANENISKKVEEIGEMIKQRKVRDKSVIIEFVPFKTVKENKIHHIKQSMKGFFEKREHYNSLARYWRI